MKRGNRKKTAIPAKTANNARQRANLYKKTERQYMLSLFFIF